MRSCWWWWCVAAGVGAACAEEPNAPPPPRRAIMLEVTPPTVTLDSAATFQLQAVARDSAGAAIPDASIIWRSFDTSLVEVIRGVVHGRRPGEARVIAAVDSLIAGSDITVRGKPHLIVVAGGDSVLPGDSLQFTATAFDANSTPLAAVFSWSTSNPARATATADGWVHGLGPGNVNVVASTGNASGQRPLKVLVPVAVVRVAPESLELAVGSRFPLRAVALSATGDTLQRRIQWTIADSGIAVVGGDHVVEGRGTGTTIAIARSEVRADTVVLTSRVLNLRLLAAGDDHTCGLATDSAAFCWGNNESGQLGNGTRIRLTAPVRAASGYKFGHITAGDDFTCGVTASGTYCWGFNLYGKLGATGVGIDTTRPVQVSGGFALNTVAAAYHDVCGLTDTGSVVCWGLNYGAPRIVTGPVFDRLVAGGGHHCALTPIGAAYCWGNNDDGRLGDSTFTARWTPDVVLGGLQFSALTAGGYHTCGTAVASGTYCWGNNYAWQLGDSVGGNAVAPRPLVAGTPAFALLGSGTGHTCGTTAAGSVYCWGSNVHLQLGPNAASTDRNVATPVGIVATHVSVGTNHVCALASTGAVCWGRNETGQLGAGDLINNATPRRVIGQDP